MTRSASLALLLVLLLVALSGCAQTAANGADQGDTSTATAVPPTATAAAPTPTTAVPTEQETSSEEVATPSWQPVVGASVADFTLYDIHGEQYTLSDFAGSPMLLNFWATWCPHCRSEVPTFQEVYAQRSADGFVVVAVSVGEQAHTVREFADENGVTFPMLLDTSREVGTLYQVQGIPASLFVDAKGVIRGTHVGAITDAAALNSVVDQLLAIE